MSKKNFKKNKKKSSVNPPSTKQNKPAAANETMLFPVNQKVPDLVKSTKSELEAENKDKVKILDASVESNEDIDEDSEFAEISGDDLILDSDDSEIDDSSQSESEMDIDCLTNENGEIEIDSDAFSSSSVEEVKTSEESENSLDDKSSKEADQPSESIDFKKEISKNPYIPTDNNKIDDCTPECKFMKEINDRKILMNKRVVFISKLNPKQGIDNIMEIISDCVGTFIRPSNKKLNKNARSGFLYFTSEETANNAIKKINSAKLNKGKVLAAFNKNSRVYDNFKNVNLTKLICASNVNNDITTELKVEIDKVCEIVKQSNGNYEITMKNVQDAFVLFNQKTMKINDVEVLFNYSYEFNNTFEKNILPTLPVVGQKRNLSDIVSKKQVKKQKIVGQSKK